MDVNGVFFAYVVITGFVSTYLFSSLSSGLAGLTGDLFFSGDFEAGISLWLTLPGAYLTGLTADYGLSPYSILCSALTNFDFLVSSSSITEGLFAWF